MPKNSKDLTDHINANNILNKTRVFKCLTQVKLQINESEKKKLVDGGDSKIDRQTH